MHHDGLGMIDLLSMGGYAPYVWGAYGICALVLVALLVVSRRRLKSLETQVQRLQPARTRSQGRTAAPGEVADHAS